ncbi:MULTISPECIES: PTS IIA-like nitrogen regulatory protein PtsN [Pseudoalteromonas]|uniref:PTS IIA-like nitrogen regulatory protein PtsN n=1 Tax=Pseudoalteromonas obscura TaxID=3048491 RepID=A0ABT7ERB9_9GAMM|nr:MULTISPECIES: PTS IIA-like nitrogen regulatory protein PtsN [Pseudoalteromonas]MBQ4838204.1 PTS IIA-like nitrogen regulatory protein PtsN [Pseudoalteromonas luteoviolacea]MDK2597515.1 PTS IIA-like nitrogen regulatory protein PtsN [Pseudoalteromonas sp. P94(2023)]
MKLSTLISEDCSKAAVLFNSKKRILQYISELAQQKIPSANQHEILEALLCREKLGSTGIGKGIAIPHGRLPGLNNIVAIILVNQQAIPFDAYDDRNVDIFVALIVPDGENKQHLETLASIAGKLNNKAFCKRLRQASNDSELHQVLVEFDK